MVDIDVSLEDLPLESLIHADIDNSCNTFNKLIEDHLAALIDSNGSNNVQKEVSDCDVENNEIFDFDIESIDVEDDIKKSDSKADTSNDLDTDECYEAADNDEDSNNSQTDKSKKFIRRQSTRIQNQMRKKIAEQIQRENNRIAKEAELLNKKKFKPRKDDLLSKISDNCSVDLDKEDYSSYLEKEDSKILSTKKKSTKEEDKIIVIDETKNGDDNDDDDETAEETTEVEEELVDTELEEPDITDFNDDDNDPNKLWCICRQTYGNRFMICCDRCLDWFHGDCVGVSQERGATMEETGEEFICPLCVNNISNNFGKQPNVVKPKNPLLNNNNPVVISDEEEEDHNDSDTDSCFITKTSDDANNIFQIMNKSKSTNNLLSSTAKSTKSNNNNDSIALVKRKKPYMDEKIDDISTLSSRTAICLNPDCRTLVNPKRSLYCSNMCIKKYSQIIINSNRKYKIDQYGLVKGLRLAKMNRFVLAQLSTETIQDEIAAPTEENLRQFLIANPTYKVFQSNPGLNRRKYPGKSGHQQNSVNTATGSSTMVSGNSNKKALEVLKIDATKRVKVVKNFALILKKLLPNTTKSSSSEFRVVWQQCVALEESIFKLAEKNINSRYTNRVNDLTKYFHSNVDKSNCVNHQILVNFLRQTLSADYLASKPLNEESDEPTKLNTSNAKHNASLLIDDNIVDNPVVSSSSSSACISMTNNSIAKPNNNTGILQLFGDSTHLHGQHFYDINCRICNKSSNKDQQQTSDDTKMALVSTSDSAKFSSLAKNVKQDVIPSATTDDENHVTTSVTTPDMDISDNEDNSKTDCTISTETAIKTSCITVINKTKTLSSVESLNRNNDNSSRSNSTSSVVKNKLPSLWAGTVSYKEMSSEMDCKAYLVSRLLLGDGIDSVKQHRFSAVDDPVYVRQLVNLSANVDHNITIHGRIQISVVEDYLRKLRKHSNKEFLIMRLHPSNLEHGGREIYQQYYEHLHSRSRCGVMNQKKFGLKDCYIYPLNAHAKVPQYLLPFNGPGLERKRPHLLLLIIIRTPLEQLKYYQSISPKYDENHEVASKHGIKPTQYNNLWASTTSSNVSSPHPAQSSISGDCSSSYATEVAAPLPSAIDTPVVNTTSIQHHAQDSCSIGNIFSNIIASQQLTATDSLTADVTTTSSTQQHKQPIIVDLTDIPIPDETQPSKSQLQTDSEIDESELKAKHLQTEEDNDDATQDIEELSSAPSPVSTKYSPGQVLLTPDDNDDDVVTTQGEEQAQDIPLQYAEPPTTNSEQEQSSVTLQSDQYCRDVDLRNVISQSTESMSDQQNVLPDVVLQQVQQLVKQLQVQQQQQVKQMERNPDNNFYINYLTGRKRVYTYYNAFPDDPDAQIKRQCYFMNPHVDWMENELITGDTSAITLEVTDYEHKDCYQLQATPFVTSSHSHTYTQYNNYQHQQDPIDIP